MGEKDDSLDRNRMAARAEESLQQAGRLVELHTRGSSAPVGDPAPLDGIAVSVVLDEPPVIAVAVHGRVAVLPLDGDQSLRT
jgi:hypothetical protein